MPRLARVKSESGFYHVIMRGAGRQVLFEDDHDRDFLLDKIASSKMENGIEVLAYALMDNHFHLLVRDEGDGITPFMRSIAVAYAMHYNTVYGHSGHVFQDRFISEPIEDDRYALSALRYILDNPRKAGIQRRRALKMTSESAYFGNGRADVVDAGFILDRFSSSDAFESFLGKDDEISHLEASEPKMSDGELRKRICEAAAISHPTELKSLEKPARDLALAEIMANGVSERRVERETGISRSVIRRAMGR
ncbi:MAG: hypothetical protein HFJ65_02680 [Eggerthellaceae bacterium]|nr:hypothetical protein [Eggerthellaceae bacterium]